MADNSDYSLQIRFIIEFFQDLTVTYILTKLGADRLLFVDAREFKQSQTIFLIQGQIVPNVTLRFDP